MLAETFLPIECSLGLKGCRQQIFPIWWIHLPEKKITGEASCFEFSGPGDLKVKPGQFCTLSTFSITQSPVFWCLRRKKEKGCRSLINLLHQTVWTFTESYISHAKKLYLRGCEGSKGFRPHKSRTCRGLPSSSILGKSCETSRCQNRRSAYTGMLEEESKQKWYSERGEGFWGMATGCLPFLPSLHLRPDVSDVRAAHAAAATRGYNHQHFFLIFVLWSHASKEMTVTVLQILRRIFRWAT